MSDHLKTQEDVREFVNRNARAVELRPSAGQGTVKTRVELQEGLRFESVEGPFRIVIDGGAKKGTDPAVDPGVLGRASLASCVAISYTMWAAKLEIPLDGLTVDLETDYDARGQYGVDDSVPAGYIEVRYAVTLRTTAPDEEVTRLADTADRHTSFLEVWGQPQKLVRELRIERPGEGA
jgi:uncharacterized OsmC-like protein